MDTNTTGVEITLSSEMSEKYFHNALCNAIGSGYMNSYGLRLDCEDKDYRDARKKLTDPCMEDVWMQILKDGKSLTLTDLEGDETKSITLKDVHERVSKTPIRSLTEMIEEQDDACTADVIIQTVFYEKVIFG